MSCPEIGLHKFVNMKINKKLEGVNKSAIIEEYLSSEDSYLTLGKKYGVSPNTIKSWVRSYRKSGVSDNESRETNRSREKELLDELEKARLKNELLEEIIKISEQNTGLDLRKKHGSKQ
jgi:transposase-like protein